MDHASHGIHGVLLGHAQHHILSKNPLGKEDPKDIIKDQAAKQQTSHLKIFNLNQANPHDTKRESNQIIQKPVARPKP